MYPVYTSYMYMIHPSIHPFIHSLTQQLINITIYLLSDMTNLLLYLYPFNIIIIPYILRTSSRPSSTHLTPTSTPLL